MPISSANALAVAKSTTRLDVKSVCQVGGHRQGGRHGVVRHPRQGHKLCGGVCSPRSKLKAALDRGTLRSLQELPGRPQLCPLPPTLPPQPTLLPTSSLFTFSFAYRSISFSHCFTLLKLSWSVTSNTTMMP